MRTFFLALAAAGPAVPAAPVLADRPSWAQAHGRNAHDRNDRNHHTYRNDDRRARVYNSRGQYNEPRRLGRNDRVWRGSEGTYHCQRENGTTGLLIGAAGGAILGNQIDGGRDKSLGTVLGAAIGGLIGRGIDLSDARCR